MLKLELTETWESWVAGLWPDTAHKIVLVQVTLPLQDFLWQCVVGWWRSLHLNAPQTVPRRFSSPPQPRSSVGGICSMLAGSPLRETFSSHLLWMVSLSRLIVCMCLCVWEKLDKGPDGCLDAKCSPFHAWQRCVARGLCSSTESIL